jgi:hypothetical protein
MNDDHNLSAFLDGELDGEQSLEMKSRAESDLAVNAKLERMRETDDLVRAAYDKPMQEDVPDRFIAVVDRNLSSMAGSTISMPASLPVAVNDNGKRWWLTGGAAVASLALGLLLGSQIMPNRKSDAAIFIALNSTPSATLASLESGQKLTPHLSFARIGGGFCRTFTLTNASTSKTGLACKAEGQWSIEALIPATDTGIPATDTGSADIGYVTAEGSATPGLDEIIAELRDGDPLGKSAEAIQLERGWK